MKPEPHYARHLTPPGIGERSTRVQKPLGWRFCCQCQDDRPAKGGRTLRGVMFLCADHPKAPA